MTHPSGITASMLAQMAPCGNLLRLPSASVANPSPVIDAKEARDIALYYLEEQKRKDFEALRHAQKECSRLLLKLEAARKCLSGSAEMLRCSADDDEMQRAAAEADAAAYAASEEPKVDDVLLPELLACPFCCSHVNMSPNDEGHAVPLCPACGATAPSEEAWNTRPKVPQ